MHGETMKLEYTVLFRNPLRLLVQTIRNASSGILLSLIIYSAPMPINAFEWLT